MKLGTRVNVSGAPGEIVGEQWGGAKYRVKFDTGVIRSIPRAAITSNGAKPKPPGQYALDQERGAIMEAFAELKRCIPQRVHSLPVQDIIFAMIDERRSHELAKLKQRKP
jgi:hypothetical protein